MSNRRNSVAIVGFALAMVGIVSCGITAVVAVVLCTIGLRRKEHRKLAVAGLVISIVILLVVSPVWLSMTPAGWVGPPLNIWKYRYLCESSFWVDYDREHLREAQSQRDFFFVGDSGSLYFKCDQAAHYTLDDVVDYAKVNGWIYGGKLPVTTEQFRKFLEESGTSENWSDLWVALHEITSYIRTPIWIKDGCTIGVFDTGHSVGMPSYVMISDDGREMAVYANHGIYPDGPHDFDMPPLFEASE